MTVWSYFRRNVSNNQERKEVADATTNAESRWWKFGYEEVLAGDITSSEIIRVKDKSFADLDNLPDPDVFGGRDSGEPGKCVGKFSGDYSAVEEVVIMEFLLVILFVS